MFLFFVSLDKAFQLFELNYLLSFLCQCVILLSLVALGLMEDTLHDFIFSILDGLGLLHEVAWLNVIQHFHHWLAEGGVLWGWPILSSRGLVSPPPVNCWFQQFRPTSSKHFTKLASLALVQSLAHYIASSYIFDELMIIFWYSSPNLNDMWKEFIAVLSSICSTLFCHFTRYLDNVSLSLYLTALRWVKCFLTDFEVMNCLTNKSVNYEKLFIDLGVIVLN